MHASFIKNLKKAFICSLKRAKINCFFLANIFRPKPQAIPARQIAGCKSGERNPGRLTIAFTFEAQEFNGAERTPVDSF